MMFIQEGDEAIPARAGSKGLFTCRQVAPFPIGIRLDIEADEAGIDAVVAFHQEGIGWGFARTWGRGWRRDWFLLASC